MNLVEIDEKEFRDFLLTSPYRTFLQSPEIGSIREQNGWNRVYLGFKKLDRLVGAVMLLSKKTGIKNEFYAIRGPLIDYENEDVIVECLSLLKDYCKNNNGYILRIDPYLHTVKKDINGDNIDDSDNNYHVIKSFEEVGFIKSKTNEQIKIGFVLDIKDKTEDELLKKMRANTRNLIGKASRIGVYIEQLGFDELDEFKNITDAAAKKNNFVNRSLNYYRQMYNAFNDKGEIKFLVAKLNLLDYSNLIKVEIEQLENKINVSKDNLGKQKLVENMKVEIINLGKRFDYVEKIRNEKGNIINLCGSMFICNMDELVYLFSGNYEEYMVFNGQYLLQWEMIKYAAKNNYNRYNFYGIDENYKSCKSSAGNYSFKKGFDGYVEELIGEYEITLSSYYYIYNLIRKLKKALRGGK